MPSCLIGEDPRPPRASWYRTLASGSRKIRIDTALRFNTDLHEGLPDRLLGDEENCFPLWYRDIVADLPRRSYQSGDRRRC